MLTTRDPTRPALLCVGLTTLDVVALPIVLEAFEGTRLIRAMQMAPAGTAAGAAIVAARLGTTTHLLGAVGADAMGRFVRSELQHEGVDVSLVATIEGATTSATLLPIDKAGVRPVYHAPGAADRLEITPAALETAAGMAAIHYAGVGAPGLAGGRGVELLKAAKAGGALTTCDLISPGASAAEELKLVLPLIDVFLPSAVEARFLTGEQDLRRAAGVFISWGAAACVIKNGGDGAVALGADGRLDLVAALPVEKIVDTTSCGDSFCAGFISATLQARPWLDALRFAAATASLVAQGPATLGQLQSFAQVDDLLLPGGAS